MPFDPNKPFTAEAPAFDPTKEFKADVPAFDPNKEFKAIDPKPGVIEQVVKGASTPFFGEQQKFSPEVTAKAREMLDKKGFDASSWSDAAVTAAMSFADTITFGNLSEIRSAASGIPEEIYEAALEIRQEEQPWSGMAGTVGGYMVPGLGAAKAASTAVRLGIPAAQALAIGAEKAEEGKTVEGIARATSEEVLSLGAGKIIGNLIKGKQSVKSAAADLMDDGLDSAQAQRIAQNAADHKVALDNNIKTIEDLDADQLKEFERVILAGQKVDKSTIKDLGPALDQYKNMVAKQTAYMEEAGVDPNIAKTIGVSLMDAQFVGNIADRRYGTQLMPTMNELSRDSIRGLWNAKDMKTQAQKAIDKLNIDSLEKSKTLIKDIEAGEGPPELTNLFETFRKNINEQYGEEVIKQRKNYVPHYTMRTPELIATLRNRVKNTTGKRAGEVGLKDLDSIRADKDLLDSLQYVGGYMGKKENMFNDEAILKLANSLNYSTSTKDFIDAAAGSAKERLSEDIPALIREMDIGKLLNGWIDSTTADAAMRDNLMKVRAEANALKEVDPLLADYFTRYANDLSGRKAGLAEWTQRKSVEFVANNLEKALEAQQAGKEALASYYTAKAEIPRYMQYSQAQLYPYFLGMRPDAVVRNLTQPYMLTIPEIGGSGDYVAKQVLKAMPQSVLGMFSGSKSKAVQELAAKGWLPPDPTPGQFQALSQGVATGGAFKKASRKFLEKANNLAMIGYQQSDLANRIVTLNLGKGLASDAIKGNKNALAYINRMPPAYRKQVKDALVEGNTEALQDRILDHLMATTQFNYNRASMSEYGRVAGSAFSQFSKWPTAIGADLFDGYDAARFAKEMGNTKIPSGNAKILRKYLGPYLMLVGANKVFYGEEGPSEQQKQLLSKDWSGAAPLSSITAPISDPGRAFTPPIFQAIKEFATGESVDTTLGLIPLATYGRFIVERAPALLENEKGQKPSEALGIPELKDSLGLE